MHVNLAQRRGLFVVVSLPLLLLLTPCSDVSLLAIIRRALLCEPYRKV
ncbi:hypothetical protein BFV94_0368 [Alteromonas macleodii]|uniref:Lipoprotein n=1 Tax=Alteromonas macleodii TaxID=28108 RepID=A0AB36G2M7_ALTMA|nr:hypothetical protein BFV95_0365 [Alteromonas macleodii]OES34775.1 hypothetical protein BFV94_0368 [Alteromonas macleodii]